ncbi:Glycosyltransferase Gtf1 [Fundidesulfovibrio magnetotacticus]|uniref:Glycosyltransferase Gtf1 n=1 Tax=Fundidesulfovibrio magnetotacticus TaxID=2730080 RepID=A0A6V8LX54_9BACT|nr:glycosyltransferase [Fundidesulfovibrio magnetotacticus]GFK94659.1 Glycosyltransferase Gtf1 [Fundidesulfovibrio magnetotacticus]
MRFQSIVLVSHVTDLSGPSEAVENYLASRSGKLGVIYHPFHYCQDRRSCLKEYRDGAPRREVRQGGWALPALATYVKDVLFTLWYFFRLGGRFDVYLGADPLNTVVGVLLKWLGRTDFVIFYTIDWMPERFSNKWLNAVYHWLDRFCVRHCDAAWNISPRIQEVRRSQGLPDAKNILVPVGVNLEQVVLPDKTGRKPSELVLLGALAPSKGVDLVIEAFPLIRERCPGVTLHVIGKTPHEAVEDGVVYQPFEPRLAALGEGVVLHGAKPHAEVLAMLPGYDVSLALYRPSANNLSQWADPSRVKDYLACGLPVVITPVPEIHKDVAALEAGLVAPYEAKAMADAVASILEDPDRWRAMRENALAYMASYSWSAILDRVFDESFRART